MAMTTNSIAGGDAAMALGRGRTGRSNDDQGGLPGGFAAALGAAEAVTPPPAEARAPRREDAARGAARHEAASDGTDEADEAQGSDAADRAPAAQKHGKRRAASQEGSADPAAIAPAAVASTTAATDTVPAQAVLAGAAQALAATVAQAADATPADTAAASAVAAAATARAAGPARGNGPVQAPSSSPVRSDAVAVGAKVSAGPAGTAAAVAASSATMAAAAADGTAVARTPATPVAETTTSATSAAPQAPDLTRTALPAAAAAAAGAGRADAVPQYQSNFARMQQALAHAPAGGKGAAADTTKSLAEDLGATLTGLAASIPVGQAVASTVSLAEGATRVGGTLADMAAMVRPAEVAGAGAGAGRPGDSGGQASQGGQGEAGAGAAPVTGLGFGATTSLDGGNWNNGFSTAVQAADAGAAGVDNRTAEEVLADQISGWVHKKTQSAELTLDAFGGSAVDVRISMTGSEAQVAFQSDSEATRQLLGGAVDQLRDLLQSQGLVLSGVSVGGSGASQAGGQSGSGEGRGNGRGRGATGAVDGAADVAQAPRRPATDPQRALDVFI